MSSCHDGFRVSPKIAAILGAGEAAVGIGRTDDGVLGPERLADGSGLAIFIA